MQDIALKVKEPIIKKLERLIESRAAIIFLVALAFIVRVIFAFGSAPILWPDSVAYNDWAVKIAEQGDFFHHVIYRTPFYPIFLSLFFKLFGHTPLTGFSIVAVQHLLGVVTMLCVYGIARQMLGAKVAFLSGLLVSLAPRGLYYELTIETETLFTVILAAVLFLLVHHYRTPSHGRIRSWIFIGALSGFMSLTRPIGQFLPFILAGYIVLHGAFSRTTIMRAACMVIVYLAVLFPWVFFNYSEYGFIGLSRDLGLNLFHRVFDVDHTPVSEHANNRIRAIYEEVRKEHAVTYFYVYFRVYNFTKSYVEADRKMARFALKSLKESPAKLQFIKNSFETFMRLFFVPRNSVNFCPAPGAPVVCCPQFIGWSSASFPNVQEVGFIPIRKTMYKIYSLLPPPWVSALFILIGIVVALKNTAARFEVHILLLTILYFAALTALFNVPEDRFRVPIDGILWIFAAQGMLTVITVLFNLVSATFNNKSDTVEFA